MTLPKLRELAEKAKAFRPPNNCREHPIVACGACAVCRGAQRAVEDIASAIDGALTEAEEVFTDGPVRAMKWDHSNIIDLAVCASRVASYFGAPGDVAAFEAGVREMCDGN